MNVARVPTFAGCLKADLKALSATADLVDLPEGTVLGIGQDLARWWWMPVTGWLLLTCGAEQARTIPSGWSWMACDHSPGQDARLTALHGSRVLTAPLPRLRGALDEHPRLAEAIRATLVA